MIASTNLHSQCNGISKKTHTHVFTLTHTHTTTAWNLSPWVKKNIETKNWRSMSKFCKWKINKRRFSKLRTNNKNKEGTFELLETCVSRATAAAAAKKVKKQIKFSVVYLFLKC